MRVLPVIGLWLREANDCLGTRLITAAPTKVAHTIRIDGFPTTVKPSPGTTLGCAEAPRSVLGEMEPALVSDLVRTTFNSCSILHFGRFHQPQQCRRYKPCCRDLTTLQSQRIRPE